MGGEAVSVFSDQKIYIQVTSFLVSVWGREDPDD